MLNFLDAGGLYPPVSKSFTALKKSLAMTKIQLIGDLDFDLIVLGLKSGDIVWASSSPQRTTGAMYFERTYNGHTIDCVVWPENYKIVCS